MFAIVLETYSGLHRTGQRKHCHGSAEVLHYSLPRHLFYQLLTLRVNTVQLIATCMVKRTKQTEHLFSEVSGQIKAKLSKLCIANIDALV